MKNLLVLAIALLFLVPLTRTAIRRTHIETASETKCNDENDTLTLQGHRAVYGNLCDRLPDHVCDHDGFGKCHSAWTVYDPLSVKNSAFWIYRESSPLSLWEATGAVFPR